MAGYNAIISLRRLEERVDRLGFRWGHPKHGGYSNSFGDQVALYPKEDRLPIYSRDAELFVGTLEQMEYWLQGWEKLQTYHSMLLGKSHDKNVLRKEQDYRNEQLMAVIKTGELEDKRHD